MADSFSKKEREKKKRRRKKEKAERREKRKSEGKSTVEFMYLDQNGNLTPTPPDPSKKEEIKAEEIELGIPQQVKSNSKSFERTGVVKFFNASKGYGFIVDSETGQSYFVHSEHLLDPVEDNVKVEFQAGNGPKGPVALSVKLV